MFFLKSRLFSNGDDSISMKVSSYSRVIEDIENKKYLRKIKLNSITELPNGTSYIFDNYWQSISTPLAYGSIRAAIEDIIYHYIYHINFPEISKERLYKFYLIHLSKGKKTFKAKLVTNVLPFSISSSFVDDLQRDFISSSQINSCPFAVESKEIKKEFYDVVWKFIEEDYFPRFYQKFISQSLIQEYLRLARSSNIRDESNGKLALFHLGLLGKFQREELD